MFIESLGAVKNGACVFRPCGRGSLRLQTSRLGGRSSGAANRLGLVATRPSAARGLEGRACVGNASICVFKSRVKCQGHGHGVAK